MIFTSLKLSGANCFRLESAKNGSDGNELVDKTDCTNSHIILIQSEYFTECGQPHNPSPCRIEQGLPTLTGTDRKRGRDLMTADGNSAKA
ncbi:unnamed protein product [Echinostoma caproni]|uniref:Secreted protein n=1 Tax=Echinostoma caproni TaxID=27848 RepID=A0A183AH82_9TREM|nr:unnamed protein product [Echinostoma caproni]